MSCRNRIVVTVGGVFSVALMLYMTLTIVTFPLPPYQLVGIGGGVLVGSIISFLTHLAMTSGPPAPVELQQRRIAEAISPRKIAIIGISGAVGGNLIVALLNAEQVDGFILFITVSMTIFFVYLLVQAWVRP